MHVCRKSEFLPKEHIRLKGYHFVKSWWILLNGTMHKDVNFTLSENKFPCFGIYGKRQAWIGIMRS